MTSTFLESTFLFACPGYRSDWDALRRARPAGDEPSAAEFLTGVRFHVLGLLAARQVVEFTRFALTVERVLAEADPVLADLLRDELIEPLAQAAAVARVPDDVVVPHLGPRTRALWGGATA